MSASGLRVHMYTCTFKDLHQEETAAISWTSYPASPSLPRPSVAAPSFDGFNPKDKLFAIFPPLKPVH